MNQNRPLIHRDSDAPAASGENSDALRLPITEGTQLTSLLQTLSAAHQAVMHDKTIKNDDLTQLSDSLRVLPVQVGTRVEVPKSVPWAAGGEPIITPRTAQLGSIALQDFDENDQWQYMIEGKVWPYEDGDITFLPPAVAAKLPGPDLNCDKVNVLPVETARAIRQNKNIKGVISFDHLGSISDSVAEELAGCDVKILSLNGLKKLSPTAAKALATFRGEDLYLRGVQSLSTEAAQALSDCEIWHVMLGLTALTADEAEGIGRSHIKLLTLSNLTVLTPEAARGISHFKGSRLALAEVTGLSPEAAAHLATLDPNVELYLANLAAMHVEVAKAFHRFKGYLLCPAVEAMTPEAARALCKCEGANLYFVNVDFSSFPSEVQEWLNDPLRNKAKIQFHGKVFLSRYSGKTMSTPPNIHRDEHDQQGENSTPSIPLEIESSTSAQSLLKPPEDIEAKIQHNHPVLGKDIHHFREELENTMVVVGGEKVSLPELKTNPEHKENIRIWKAVLSDEDTMEIEKMTLITEPVAEKIVHLNRGHFVYLVGLRKLTPETARILARSPKQLRLNELQSITPEVAKELARHAGDALWLCRLKDLSEDAAKELSKHRGYLNVAGLKTLSDGALAHLFKHEGKMNLANVTRFGNVDIDEFVRKYEDGESYINFGELEQITDAQLASLAKHTKSKSKYVGTHLKLGITVLSNTQAKFLENYGGELDFIRLRSISETGIVSLATGNKSVTLGVTQLTDRSAEALSKVSDNLSLWYLESMNDAQAESFSKHKGKLNLGKVSSLTDAQAQSLSRHDGEVYFSELRTISDLGIQALAKGKARIGGCSDLHIRIKKMRQEADLKD